MLSVFLLCLMACHNLGLAWGLTSPVDPASGPEALPVIGEAPILTTDVWPLYACDHRGDIWMFSTEGTWSFSLDSLRWKQHPTLPYGDPQLVAGYDRRRQQFLFWSVGVGLVFAWRPGEPAMRRLDHSFNHRNQIGHSGVVHPRSGTIYAFGGEGFWENTSILTRFDRMSREWQIVSLSDTSEYPEPRRGSMATLDPRTSQLFVMSGMSFVGHRQDLSAKRRVFNDFWVFDLNGANWKKRPVHGLPEGVDIDLETVGDWGSTYNAVLDTSNALVWFPLRLTSGSPVINLYAYDINNDVGALLPIHLTVMGQSSQLKFLTYDPVGHRMILFWNNVVGKEGDVRIQVSGFKLPPADSVRAMIGKVRDRSLNRPIWVAAWMGGLLLVLLAGGALIRLHRARPTPQQIPEPSPEATPSPAPDPIQDRPVPPHKASLPHEPQLHVSFLGKPTIRFMGELVNSQFGKIEFELFIWLVWQLKMGRPYVLTDTMEPLFWPAGSTPDYVRKMRNTALKKLDEQLADIFAPKFKRENWVVDRMLLEDRRKREYGVDLSPMEITTDCDPFFDAVRRSAPSLDVAAYNKSFAKGLDIGILLEPCKGAWADAVRKEAREWLEY